MPRTSTLLIALALASTSAVPAVAGMNGVDWLARQHIQADQQRANAPWVTARVTTIDRAKGTLTIAHGAITSIGMPAMLMTYAAADPASVAALNKGDLVNVQLNSQGGVANVVKTGPWR